jgi:uncharacterized membrane protein YkoI
MAIRSSLVGAALLGLAIVAAAAFADDDQDRARELTRSGNIVPLERITEQVRGRGIDVILEVELESDKRGHYYEVEGVDAAGVVRKLRYDAITGEPIDKRR